MKCTICGKATSHGTLLCRPCKAALKRARQLTVQELPKRSVRARTRGAGRRDVLNEPATGIDALRRPMPDHAGRLLIGVVAIAALVGAAYGAARGLAGHPAMPPAHVAQSLAADPVPSAGAAPAERADVPMPAPPALPELTLAPVTRSNIHPATRVASVSTTSSPNANNARVPAPPVAAAASYPPLDSFGPLAEAPKPAPSPVAAVRAPPPPPDRWQTMTDALSRCASEGGFSGFICDQRVRLASCDGYWGRVAQCPNPPENPR
jgi:hypothetical protein